MTRKNRC